MSIVPVTTIRKLNAAVTCSKGDCERPGFVILYPISVGVVVRAVLICSTLDANETQKEMARGSMEENAHEWMTDIQGEERARMKHLIASGRLSDAGEIWSAAKAFCNDHNQKGRLHEV